MYTARAYTDLTGALQLNGNEDKYQVVSITGLDAPEGQINMQEAAGIDGAIYNSARLGTRNIVITLAINGDADENRRVLSSYFIAGNDVRIYYETENRNIYADGKVETVECEPFEQKEYMQISIICPDPYLQDVNESEASWANAGEIFHAANDADADVGFLLQFDIEDDAETVILSSGSAAAITLSGQFYDGDAFTIDTREESLSVRVIRDGVELNMLNTLVRGSTFFQLAGGATTNGTLNVYDGEGEDCPTYNNSMTYRKRYRGV